jgi:putative component of membrane protein insertase Oxa1/YidC/SpoIIIJ protein YidD
MVINMKPCNPYQKAGFKYVPDRTDNIPLEQAQTNKELNIIWKNTKFSK